MGLAYRMMSAGVAFAEAQTDFIASINTGISAAGTTQGTATALTACVNLVSTVAASSGVQLYNALVGDSMIVFNDAGANSLNVYPPTSGKINNIATNGPVVLGINTSCLFMKITSTRWIAILSA